MIQANLEQALARYGEAIPISEHPHIRSEAACYASTQLAVGLAREHGAQLHVLHISTARELELFEPGPLEGKSVTAETCIHFLHFTDADYERYGNLIKCNPAIKRQADQAELLAALRDGRIDVLATDHAPHTLEEKAADSYLKAPSGLPLVQDVLLATLELVHDGELDLATAVRLTAHNPARRYAVRERGFLHEGARADLVLVDMGAETPVTRQRALSRCGWSPFEGRRFRSRIDAVWINGVLAFDGENVIEHDAAMRLEFDRAKR
jgi:dihydroorotase